MKRKIYLLSISWYERNNHEKEYKNWRNHIKDNTILYIALFQRFKVGYCVYFTELEWFCINFFMITELCHVIVIAWIVITNLMISLRLSHMYRNFFRIVRDWSWFTEWEVHYRFQQTNTDWVKLMHVWWMSYIIRVSVNCMFVRELPRTINSYIVSYCIIYWIFQQQKRIYRLVSINI